MSRPTLRNLVDLPSVPPPLRDSALVLVDCQNTYTYGVMELDGVQAAVDERLEAVGATNLVLAGFMTHMCINSTARGGFSLGYAPTVVASATATRPLPGVGGETD